MHDGMPRWMTRLRSMGSRARDAISNISTPVSSTSWHEQQHRKCGESVRQDFDGRRSVCAVAGVSKGAFAVHLRAFPALATLQHSAVAGSRA